jgi:geranylgeranyl pyrophosphate synthase/predicted secreted hydrolase
MTDDWPGEGPIDLAVHDLPHGSSSTEWWYVHGHARTSSGRRLSLFASFFRVAVGRDDDTGDARYVHSCTWALSDPQRRRYRCATRLDGQAPRVGLERMDRGEGARDPRLRRALREVLERGNVPHPDRMFRRPPRCATNDLDLDFDGDRFHKSADGTYHLRLCDGDDLDVDVVFTPEGPPIRHGDQGRVRGATGEDMFYYFLPRCSLTGSIRLGADAEPVAHGTGWYDHEFGRVRPRDGAPVDMGWTWCALQLEDGTCVTAYVMVEEKTNTPRGQCAVVIGPDGARTYSEMALSPLNRWCSTRTFRDYPTRFRLDVPEAGLSLAIDAAFDDQELVTLISKPAFWEGRCDVSGHLGGRAVRGLGYLERSGFSSIETLDDFFGAVGREVRRSLEAYLPHRPSFEQVQDLVASPQRPERMAGVDIEMFAKAMVAPIREITDRGGKSWRSYAALACCDIVGGDSRRYVQWLAFPELMHVGSLIVDDVQDRSTVRRGGPTAHLIHGEALAINAGTACYFLGQQLLVGPDLSDAHKLRLYELYFESLRAGHSGQALDLAGLDAYVPEVVTSGDATDLERRVLAIHRLKTAVPAASLARMGGVVGGGTEAQIEALGRFFEALGLAFQIVDDVLNLRGFRGDLKERGEDLRQGKVTLPVAKAMGRLPEDERRRVWAIVSGRSSDPAVVGGVIETLEACGAVEACATQARELIEDAWTTLEPLVEDSLPKVMLRAFGWYVLDRHY